MKGETLFEKMTGISDEFVKEAALVAPITAESGQKRRTSPWRRGLSAACIVLVAVVALLLGTAGVGRIATPAPEGTPPLARFGFTYELSGFDGTAMPGDTVSVNTTIINRGLPFVYHGSYASYHPEAYFVLQGNESVSMQCAFMETCDSGPHAVTMGMEGRGYGEITIPADAVPGVYDLVLSYKGMTQVYKGVLTVGESEGETEGESETETQPPVDTADHPFSFGYELAGDAAPGTFYHMDTWVVNEGASFTFEGSSMGFAPSAVLIHMETRYRIEGNFDVTTDFRQVTVNTGDKGQVMQEFMIPADAPTGVYTLVLSYDGATQSFAEVVTVRNPEEETQPPVDTPNHYELTFDYEVLNTWDPAYAAWKSGDTIRIQVSVTNHGAPFTYEGSSGDFIPHAVLSLTTADDPRQTLQVYGLDIPLPDDHGVFTVAEGETGTAVYEFVLPNDIPAGKLYLTMSYNGQETGNIRVGNVSDATYTMEEAIAFAKELLAVQYPEIDLSGYAIRCVDSLGAGLHYRVQFLYLYYGYTVDGGNMIEVSLTADKKLAGLKITDKYEKYTALVTEEDFLSTIQSIRDGITSVDPSVNADEVMEPLLYFNMDKEGYLCLTVEYIGPPILDENGNSLSGCVDHEHYFFGGRLSTIP